MKFTPIEQTLLFLAYNLKGKKVKRDDWITIAEKCKEAVDYFNSYEKVAERTNTSSELVRSVVRLLKLPDEVKQLVKERKIGMDIAQKITRIENPKDQIMVAKQIVGLSSHDARSLVEFAKRNPKASASDYENHKVRLFGAKRKKKEVHITIIPLEGELYRKLKEKADKEKMSPEKLIVELIKRSIEG